MEKDENGFPTGERVRYRPGSFVYRLAGRDRQTSASYYTPQSLTSVTVQLALEQRIKEEGRPVIGRRGPALAGVRARARLRCVPQRGHRPARRPVPAAARGRDRRPPRTGRARPRPAAGQGVHRPAQLLRRRPERDRRRARRGLDLAQRHAPRPPGPLVRPAPGPRQLPDRRRSAAVPAGRSWPRAVAEDRARGRTRSPRARSRPGHIHHFLLPAEGWGAVAGEKEAKELAPEDTKRLGDWRKGIRKPPSAKKSRRSQAIQVQRLQALAGRAEYLWSLVIERLRISEREISRAIDVWGAEDLPGPWRQSPRRDRRGPDEPRAPRSGG